MNLTKLKGELDIVLASLMHNNDILLGIDNILNPLELEDGDDNLHKSPKGLIEELFQYVYFINNSITYQSSIINNIRGKVFDDDNTLTVGPVTTSKSLASNK